MLKQRQNYYPKMPSWCSRTHFYSENLRIKVLKHTNGELSKAKQLASSQGSLILRDDDVEKIKNRVISDLGDIEANNSLELSDQIEQYKLL